ncbi:MAG: hypothetical protein AAFY73_06515 [Pseudomonadota bacterium]
MDTQRAKTIVNLKGDMPLVRDLAFGIWGDDCIFDADGDASSSEDVHWRRLYICPRRRDETSGRARSDESQRFELAPVAGKEEQLLVSAADAGLLKQVLTFLADHGTIQRTD